MLTETFLRRNERWIKMLTGLTAEQFWTLFAQIENDCEDYEHERLQRPDRKRAVGAGNTFRHPLLLRVLAVLTYLRLHLTQELTAAWFGMQQYDISRDLRRLLPLLQRHLPVPAILAPVSAESGPVEPEAELVSWLQDMTAVLDATEQAIERPKDAETQREYYSGKKKRHTVKTQVVVNLGGEFAAMTPAEPGKTADIEIAKHSRVVERLPEGTQVYDDKGYVGLEKTVPPCAAPKPVGEEASAEAAGPRVILHTPTKKPRGGELTPEQKERNHQIGKVRIIVEHALGHLKNWRILAERFRCALALYTDIFRTIAGLVNFQKRHRRQRLVAA
jgi:hypothetical protein